MHLRCYVFATGDEVYTETGGGIHTGVLTCVSLILYCISGGDNKKSDRDQLNSVTGSNNFGKGGGGGLNVINN